MSSYNPNQATSFVVVGKRTGETELFVESGDETLTYAVKIIAASEP